MTGRVLRIYVPLSSEIGFALINKAFAKAKKGGVYIKSRLWKRKSIIVTNVSYERMLELVEKMGSWKNVEVVIRDWVEKENVILVKIALMKLEKVVKPKLITESEQHYYLDLISGHRFKEVRGYWTNLETNEKYVVLDGRWVREEEW